MGSVELTTTELCVSDCGQISVTVSTAHLELIIGPAAAIADIQIQLACRSLTNLAFSVRYIFKGLGAFTPAGIEAIQYGTGCILVHLAQRWIEFCADTMAALFEMIAALNASRTYTSTVSNVPVPVVT